MCGSMGTVSDDRTLRSNEVLRGPMPLVESSTWGLNAGHEDKSWERDLVDRGAVRLKAQTWGWKDAQWLGPLIALLEDMVTH